MSATAVPTARRRQAPAVLIALLTAVLAGPAAALAALPAAAAPNVAAFTLSPASPSQTDAVTMTLTIDGCAGQEPWNVYYLVDSQPYTDADRENAHFPDGVLTNGGDTWTSSVTLPAGSFEAGAYNANAYGIGPTCFTNGGQFLDSNIVQFSVPQIDTTVSGIAPMTAVAGDTVHVDVAVNPASATGPVTITENGTTWGNGTLSQGTASVDAGPLTAGSHDLVVAFDGDRNHSGSTSAPIHVDVARAPSPLTVVATPSPSIRFQDVTVDVTAPASATGQFEVSEGGVVLSSGNALVDGVGSTVLDDLAVGSHHLLVTYSGSTEHEPSTATTTVVVDLRPTTTSLDADRDGSKLTLTAEVLPDADWHTWAEGSVQFTDGDVVIGTAELSSGVAELVLPSAAVGSHQLQAHYLGDDTSGPSDSTVVTAVVPVMTVASPVVAPSLARTGPTEPLALVLAGLLSLLAGATMVARARSLADAASRR